MANAFWRTILEAKQKVISCRPATPAGRRRRRAAREEGGRYYKNTVLRKFLIFNEGVVIDKYLT